MNFFTQLVYSHTPYVVIFACLLSTSLAVGNSSDIELPPGATNHGDPRLLCTPTTWKDVALFFASNYLAHVATVRVAPGAPPLSGLTSGLFALFFPMASILNGIEIITACGIFAKTDLQKAVRAGALCRVVRSDSALEDEGLDREHGAQENRKRWRYVEKGHQIHGECVLPPNPHYLVMRLSPKDEVEPIPREIPSGAPIEMPREITMKLASSHSILAGMVGIFQTVSAAVTIYRSLGDQINRYGYAAFGLTVIPYALMSIINLIAGLLTPTYHTLYMVSSWEMEEAKAQHGRFHGVVGRVIENKTDDSGHLRPLESRFWPEPLVRIFKKYGITPLNFKGYTSLALKVNQLPIYERSRHPRAFGLLLTIVLPMPLIIIYFLTDFDAGKSSRSQRAWVMCWLLFGISGSPIAYFQETHNRASRIPFSKLRPGFLNDSHDLLLTRILVVLIFGTAAIGGMVTVGQMLMEYGTCELLPGE